MDLGLEGKVAIVTGGSDGIGRAAAAALAREGARVAICARTADRLTVTAADIRARCPGAALLAIPTDVSDEAQVKSLVAAVVDAWGGVDILVNNAGTSSAMKFEDVTDAVLDADFQLKVYGAIYGIRAVLPHMKRTGGGAIVNVTNLGGKAAPAASNPTSMARAAGLSLTKSLSKELASHNVRVNAVCIGLVKSGQHRARWETRHAKDPSYTLEQHWAQMATSIPLGRVAEAEEAGDLIAFLASDRARFVTGTAINFDGGTSPVL